MAMAAEDRAKETETRSSLSQIESVKRNQVDCYLYAMCFSRVETFKSVGWETVKDGEIDSDPAKVSSSSPPFLFE